MHRQDLWYRTDPKTGEKIPTERHGKGARWRVRSKEPGVPNRTFAKASEADQYIRAHTRAAIVAELGLEPERPASGPPLRDVAADWQATWTVKGKTPASYRSQLRKHVLPALGDRPVDEILVFDVRLFQSTLITQGYAHTTVKNAVGVLRQILDTAVEKNYIKANPAASVKMPKNSARVARKRQKDNVVFLTARQVNQLAAAMPEPDLALMIQFVAYTGLRAGENAGLRVGDFRFREGQLQITRNIYITDKPEADASPEVIAAFQADERAAAAAGLPPCHRIGQPKNGEPRTIAVPEFLIERLEAYVARTGRRQRDWMWPGIEYRRIDQTKYPDRDGREREVALTKKCLNHGDFYRYVFGRAAVAAGLDNKLTFHSLRHTCAALLISRGVDAKTLQAHMGHQSYDITMDTYGHLYEEAQSNLALALQEVWDALPAADKNLEHLSGKSPSRTGVLISEGTQRGHKAPNKDVGAPRVTSTYGSNLALITA